MFLLFSVLLHAAVWIWIVIALVLCGYHVWCSVRIKWGNYLQRRKAKLMGIDDDDV